MMNKLITTLSSLLMVSLAASQSVRSCKGVILPNVRQIDAGAGQVVAVSSNYGVFHLHGSTWYSLNNFMQHVTVGPAGIWGVDRKGYVNKIVAGRWARTTIRRMRQVDAGGDQFVTAAGTNTMTASATCVNRSTAVDFRPTSNPVSTFWIKGRHKYYSCGPDACWAVNYKDEVFVAKVDPRTCNGRNDVHKVDGSLTMVEVATDGSVYGVNSQGQVLRRDGVSLEKPEGTSWTKIDVCVPAKHVSFDLGRLWVVSRTGLALECLV